MRSLLILDRFEGDTALIEYTDESGNVVFIRAERKSVSADVKEGDVLACNDGTYLTDTEATEARRKNIINQLKRHRKKNR